eukprot:1212113-Rhodomonas_salina.1
MASDAFSSKLAGVLPDTDSMGRAGTADPSSWGMMTPQGFRTLGGLSPVVKSTPEEFLHPSFASASYAAQPSAGNALLQATPFSMRAVIEGSPNSTTQGAGMQMAAQAGGPSECFAVLLADHASHPCSSRATSHELALQAVLKQSAQVLSQWEEVNSNLQHYATAHPIPSASSAASGLVPPRPREDANDGGGERLTDSHSVAAQLVFPVPDPPSADPRVPGPTSLDPRAPEPPSADPRVQAVLMQSEDVLLEQERLVAMLSSNYPAHPPLSSNFPQHPPYTREHPAPAGSRQQGEEEGDVSRPAAAGMMSSSRREAKEEDERGEEGREGERDQGGVRVVQYGAAPRGSSMAMLMLEEREREEAMMREEERRAEEQARGAGEARRGGEDRRDGDWKGGGDEQMRGGRGDERGGGSGGRADEMSRREGGEGEQAPYIAGGGQEEDERGGEQGEQATGKEGRAAK